MIGAALDSQLAQTDCSPDDDLLETHRSRMATVLIYLSDGFDDGATELTRAVGGAIKVKPPVGSALIFYSYGKSFGGRTCSPSSEHRAIPPLGGTKHVLQRWYSYRADQFLSFRRWRDAATADRRAPWQPVVGCDRLPHVEKGAPDVSCRWYNTPDELI